jgi:hypothetical protein
MTTLSTVIAAGTLAARPAAGINGRIYFANDTKRLYRDNGAAWDDVTRTAAANLAAAPSAPGNFQLAHGLSAAPEHVAIQMTSPGGIWFQTPTLFDGTYVYLVASDAGVTAQILVFA